MFVFFFMSEVLYSNLFEYIIIVCCMMWIYKCRFLVISVKNWGSTSIVMYLMIQLNCSRNFKSRSHYCCLAILFEFRYLLRTLAENNAHSLPQLHKRCCNYNHSFLMTRIFVCVCVCVCVIAISPPRSQQSHQKWNDALNVFRTECSLEKDTLSLLDSNKAALANLTQKHPENNMCVLLDEVSYKSSVKLDNFKVRYSIILADA